MEQLDEDILDNPVWFALAAAQSHLGTGGRLAARFHPAVAPFAAVNGASLAAFHELAALMAPGESVLFLSLQPLPEMPEFQVELLTIIRQMIDRTGAQPAPGFTPLRLDGASAADMLDLATLTQPGPFGPRTGETGNYVGVREGGVLVAMAGERMRLAGFTEISAVCVRESHRGQGLAANLMNLLRREAAARGERPFLHVREDNAAAIQLYGRLGFATRKLFHLYRLTRSGQELPEGGGEHRGA